MTSVASTIVVVRIRDGKASSVDVTTGLTAASLVELFGDLSLRRRGRTSHRRAQA